MKTRVVYREGLYVVQGIRWERFGWVDLDWWGTEYIAKTMQERGYYEK